jgi:DNA-directed RNA polymerase specialized sigma24 family protein
MSTLDHRLYAWLVEVDERRFERAFSAYFSLAFPAVIRHLARISRWDAEQLEELAQDALLKFFDRVGRGRREAAGAVKDALSRVRPLNLGPLHQRQVGSWTAGVASFRDAAMAFRPMQVEESGDDKWKSTVRALADRVPLLQGQGYRLLRALSLALDWILEAENQVEFTRAQSAQYPAIESNVKPSLGDETVIDAEAKNSAELLASEVNARTARALAAEEQHPGVLQFVVGTSTVVCTLPRLRIPTNSYLFEIAMSVFLDECKKRGRRKRGGAGTPDVSTAGGENMQQHPLDLLTPESNMEIEGEQYVEDRDPISVGANLSTALSVPSIDPTRQYEDEEFMERFHQYLRRPVDEAAEAYKAAQTGGKGAAERRRLETLTHKLSRTVSVLSMLGEGYTQERTAERLGISRNQVKYTIEVVQDAYARFAASDARSPTKLSSAGGPSYVS